MTSAPEEIIGFVGLGTMGQPMALNLLKSGRPLLVWNRSPSRSASLHRAAGAEVAQTPDELFTRCRRVILMLANGAAVDHVLARGTPAFCDRVREHTIINMGTHAPAYSAALAAAIKREGGKYVEAPVSGSRAPAEAGQLIAMVAGDAIVVESVQSLLAPMCRQAVLCGPVPNGLYMKLAVNIFLIATVTALAESLHFAERHGLDLAQVVSVLDAGPMASDVSRAKAAKFLVQDFRVQAAVSNVLENNRLITEAAHNARIAMPLIDVCHALFQETNDLGLEHSDMIAVIRAIEQRTALAS